MKIIEQIGEFEITKNDNGYWALLCYKGKSIASSGLESMSIVKWLKQIRTRSNKRIEKIDSIIQELESEKINLLEMVKSINKSV